MKYLSFLSVLAILAGCAEKPEADIAKPADYAAYLRRSTDEDMNKMEVELKFCRDKLSKTPQSETYRTRLGGLYASRFMLNGKIEDIVTSDSLYNLVQKGTPIQYASLHRALAANCITQHQFREASRHIQKALEIGEGKAASYFMLTDVDVELGDLAGAKTAMKNFTNHNLFPYMIREAKIKDHEGKLDSAIIIMEKALDKIMNNATGYLWTLSNLADMYGHAGRIEEAYNAYLKVLQKDPDYDYALKGIAWIAFSHDHNYPEARKIANYIATKRATPDMHLFLAKIAAAENNLAEQKRQLALFTKAATAPRYGDMYNKYIALLDAEELSSPSKTVTIAQREIHNRPTPQSYDLLAWGYFQSGDKKQALEVAQQHVENRTWEPDALYHLAIIYQANGMEREAKKYFKQIASSGFELGPEKARTIKEKLSI